MTENYKRYLVYEVYPNGDIVNPLLHQSVSTRITNGYKVATLYQGRKQFTVYVKDLIAELFMDDFDEKKVVYCKDGNPDNCSIDNLAQRKHKNISCPVCVIYPDGFKEIFSSMKSASKSTGVNQGTISRLITIGKKDKEGRLWTKLTT